MTRIGLETPRSQTGNASELKRQIATATNSSARHIEGRDLSEAQKKQALAEYELNWRKQEPERRERYQDQALIEALQALEFVGLPRSSAPPLRSAAPAAASPTPRVNSSKSSSAASMRRRPTKC